VVVIIVILFAVAAGMFAWAAALLTPAGSFASSAANNPHPSSRRTDACLTCHNTRQGTIPVTHRDYALRSCASCHHTALQVLVPHSVAMGDARCPVCHGDPGSDHGIPRNHLRYKTDECLLCHPVDGDRYLKTPPPAGLALKEAPMIPHIIGGLFGDCSYCHPVGGTHPLPVSHEAFAQETCLDCHRADGKQQGVRK
jgi:hypothetical protein